MFAASFGNLLNLIDLHAEQRPSTEALVGRGLRRKFRDAELHLGALLAHALPYIVQTSLG
jgi:hypothetical protein